MTHIALQMIIFLKFKLHLQARRKICIGPMDHDVIIIFIQMLVVKNIEFVSMQFVTLTGPVTIKVKFVYNQFPPINILTSSTFN